MKLLATFFIFMIVLQSSASNPTGPHYIGFFASAMNGVGRGDYIREVKPYSNYVYVRDLTPELIVAKVRKAKALGMQSMIAVQNVFFPWRSSKLSPTWQSDFQTLQKALQNDGDAILGFYLYDEPYWTNQQSGWVSVPNETLYKSLEFSAVELKKAYPTKFVAMTFAHPEMKAGLMIPKSVDWLGFNCYAAYGSVCSDQRVSDLFRFLLQNKSASQKLILTIDAYWNAPPTADIQSKILTRLELWKKLINSAPGQVAALMPFLYQTHTPENLYGAESFPQVQAWLLKYAQEIIK